ncbi:hypothetical protein EsH8_V_001154 [Colletotrichum jinshuiense]
MVLVYREPESEPFLLQPPSFAQIKEDIAKKRVKLTYLDVFTYIDGLLCVAEDFRIVVKDAKKSATGFPQAAMKDALSLTSLLKYMVCLPLARLQEECEALVSPGDTWFQRELQDNYILLGQIQLIALSIEVDLSGKVDKDADTYYTTEFETCSKQMDGTIDWPPLTQLSVVELLCRVVAAVQVEVNSADHFQEILKSRLKNLASLEPLPQKEKVNYLGLPKIIFACAGNPDVTPRAMVITTSGDEWCGLPSHAKWSEKNRAKLRPKSKLVQESGGMSKVLTESKKVRKAWKKAEELPPNEQNKRYLEIVTSDKVDFATANHLKEQAMPLSCPRFDAKPRCYRCLALFKYDVPPSVEVKETNLRGLFTFWEWSCAETIAQAYCCRAAVETGH